MDAYENLGPIGEGTYGVVLKARHKVTGQIVAIKKFKESDDDEQVRKTALREIRLLKQLKNNHVVELIEVFRRKGKLYLVFEYVEKTILEELEKHPDGLDPNSVRLYLYQLFKALSFIHSQNIIHRDIKPENLLVSKHGVLKLCDFGFARTLSHPGVKLTDYVATRWYRAPELLVGDANYGKAVDVWAAGCMFAEIINGQPLFPGESDIDQLYHMMKCLGKLTTEHMEAFSKNPLYVGVKLPALRKLEPLSQRFPNLDRHALSLLKACLAYDPAQRSDVDALLRHPYFDGVRELYDDMINRAVMEDCEEQNAALAKARRQNREAKMMEEKSMGFSEDRAGTFSAQTEASDVSNMANAGVTPVESTHLPDGRVPTSELLATDSEQAAGDTEPDDDFEEYSDSEGGETEEDTPQHSAAIAHATAGFPSKGMVAAKPRELSFESPSPNGKEGSKLKRGEGEKGNKTSNQRPVTPKATRGVALPLLGGASTSDSSDKKSGAGTFAGLSGTLPTVTTGKLAVQGTGKHYGNASTVTAHSPYHQGNAQHEPKGNGMAELSLSGTLPRMRETKVEDSKFMYSGGISGIGLAAAAGGAGGGGRVSSAGKKKPLGLHPTGKKLGGPKVSGGGPNTLGGGTTGGGGANGLAGLAASRNGNRSPALHVEGVDDNEVDADRAFRDELEPKPHTPQLSSIGVVGVANASHRVSQASLRSVSRTGTNLTSINTTAGASSTGSTPATHPHPSQTYASVAGYAYRKKQPVTLQNLTLAPQATPPTSYYGQNSAAHKIAMVSGTKFNAAKRF